MASEALFDGDTRSRVDMLRQRYYQRDANAAITMHARRGDFDKIDPEAFSDEYPRPIVANQIETMARHAAAQLSVMPTLRCRAASMGASDAAKARADKRTQIVNHYFTNARFREQIQVGADHLYTFGMIVTQVVPDFTDKLPVPTVRDSLGFYPVWDGRGRTIEAAHVFRKRVVDLAAQYPEHAALLDKAAKQNYQNTSHELEVYHHDDGKQVTILVPACNNLVLHRYKNPVGKCLFVCTRRPTPDGEIRGALDDQVYVQLARNELYMLLMESTQKAVDAPIALPLDASEFAYGPDAVIRSATPRDVGRVQVNVPSEAFAGLEGLKDEMTSGAMVPEAMSGSMDASVITGRGIQQLGAGYSQQIAMMQETLVGHYTQVAERALAMDEALWADEEKQISGYRTGAEYQLKYVPSKDIAGNLGIDVTFGTATGLEPSRQQVWLLQSMGAGLLSRDTVLREMPGEYNAADEMKKIQIEQARDALMASVQGLGGAIPGIIAEGGDASQVVSQLAEFVAQLQKGKEIEEIASKVFAPPEPPPEAEQDPMAMMGGAEGGDPMAAMMGGGGGGAAPPADTKNIQNFFAGLTSSGEPNMAANVQRSRPAV